MAILIVDALNLFSRHYIRNPAMSTTGQQAGGIVGFMNALKYLNELVRPNAVYVVWEAGGSMRRRSIFSGYKQNRRPPKLNRYYEDIPDSGKNRVHQIKFLSSILKHVGVKQIYVEDCEADDVIGYICRNSLKNEKKIIASNDSDLHQLLNETTAQYSWSTKSFMGPDDVRTKYRISVENFVLAKAVCGDKSDNVPGIPGIGFKTLAKRFDLVTRELNIDELVDMSKSMLESDVAAYRAIIDNVDLIKRNWRLMYLDTANLAAVQVRKIDAVVESPRPAKNKMQLMKSLLDEGLGAFDVHDFFSSFSSV